MEEKKTVSVRIGNMTYQISAKKNAAYIEEIAKEADAIIKSIQADNPGLNTVNLAILALINALDQKAKLESSLSADEDSILAIQQEHDKLNAEKLELRELCWNLKKELLYYKNMVDVYEERINDLNQISLTDKKIAKPIPNKTLKPLDKLQTSFSDLDNE